MSKRTSLIAFLALACCWPTACQLGPHESEISSRQFQDVVVPADFRLDGRTSSSSEEATYKKGHFEYYGGQRVAQAAEYVQRRMPQHNWQLVGQQTQEDPQGQQLELSFERGIYSATYVFLRRDGTTRMVVDYSTDYSKL